MNQEDKLKQELLADADAQAAEIMARAQEEAWLDAHADGPISWRFRLELVGSDILVSGAVSASVCTTGVVAAVSGVPGLPPHAVKAAEIITARRNAVIFFGMIPSSFFVCFSPGSLKQCVSSALFMFP